MASLTSPSDPDGRPGRTLARPTPGGMAATAVMLTMLVMAGWSIVSLQINVATLLGDAGNAVDVLTRALPLDFPPVDEVVQLCKQTLAIVVSATLLAVLISIPLAVLAASNTTPHFVARYSARGLVVLARAIPDVVLAIVFVRAFGLGALAGGLAMGLHSVGMVSKLYADTVEQIDEGARMAVRATGAKQAQELIAGVLPQVLSAFIATALHRFDINLRVSVLLGFVGVSGIGFEIANALRRLDYQRGLALALIIVLFCVALELMSGTIRRLLRGDSGEHRRIQRCRHELDRRDAIGSHLSRVTGEQHPMRTSVRTSPPWTLSRVRRFTFVGLTAVIVLVSVKEIGVSLRQLLVGLSSIGHTLGLFWPPETGSTFSELLANLLITIQIALASTLIGALLAFPVGVLAAGNTAPLPSVAKCFRLATVLVRGMPELMLAILFVVIIGLGPVAGVLALSIGATGLLSKLVADSLEETDDRVQQALGATGATRLQVFFSATLPQVLPAWVAHVLYQLDVNVRAATLLGIVGAGGLGFYLQNASRVMEFGVITTVIFLIFVAVLTVELLALWLRRIIG